MGKIMDVNLSTFINSGRILSDYYNYCLSVFFFTYKNNVLLILIKIKTNLLQSVY